MNEKLNLALPERGKSNSRTSKLVVLLLACLLIVGMANLFFTLYPGLIGENKGPSKRDISVSSGNLSAEATKQLALKLEKQGLNIRAVSSWNEYLFLANAGKNEQANIWYRIGKLYQESEMYEEALESFYRSESHAKLSSLELDINQRIQESLESLGKFTALRYVLADRVEMNQNEGTTGVKVLAEIGSQKITKAELDRQIEEQIERQISMYASFLPDDQRKKQKETLLKKYSTTKARSTFLKQIVMEEVLYRKAREDKLTEDPGVRKIIRDNKRSILASQVMNKELSARIQITPGDLQTYYKANIKQYVEPEQVQISHILINDRKTGEKLLNKLKQNASFIDLAKKYSIDETTKNKGGEINAWVKKGGYIPGIGNSAEANQAIFNTKTGDVKMEIIKSEKGFHIFKIREHKAKQRKMFDDVRQDAYRALYSQKDGEVRERYFAQLKDRYDVVMHWSSFQGASPDKVRKVSITRDHIFGNPDAEVSFIEYSDFECPFCKDFHKTPKKIVENYGGKVNWVYRHFPIGTHNPAALKEAEASECASELGGNEAFWKYADLIYARTKSNGKGVPFDQLVPFALEIGLDGDNFKSCLESGKYQDRVQEDFAEGSQAGISGTPGNIILNNKTGAAVLKSGALPIEELQVEIDKILQK